jgi:hypothetical protein
MQSRIIPGSMGRSAFFTAAVLLLLQEPRCQLPYIANGRIASSQFMLPWDGPGAATFNPALLSETRRYDARLAFHQSVSGKSEVDFYQGAARIYGGLFAGLAYFSNGSAIDGSNAVYETYILTPMIAYCLDSIAGSGYSFAAGIALPKHGFLAFGAVETPASALDMGLSLLWPSMGRAGSLQTGLIVRNLFAGQVTLPDDNPESIQSRYDALRVNYDASILLSGVAGLIDLYAEMNLEEPLDPREGPVRDGIPFFKSLGAAIRPIPMVGFKIERTWLQQWTTGADFRYPVNDFLVLGAEMNLAHDAFLSGRDEGRGYLWSLALSVGG